MHGAVEDEADDIREVLWVKGVAGRLAHVSADGQRDLLDLHVVLVAAGQTAEKQH